MLTQNCNIVKFFATYIILFSSLAPLMNNQIENRITGLETIPTLRQRTTFLSQMGLVSWMEQNCSLQSESEEQ